MDQANILIRLSSPDDEEVLRTLYELGSHKYPTPNEHFVARLLEMLRSPSADIRERAVFVLGMHWRVSEAYEPILLMLRTGKDEEEIRIALVSAMGSLTRQEHGNNTRTSRCLAAIALDEAESQSVRGEARLQLLRIHGMVSVSEYARLGLDLAQVPEDRQWLKALARE